MDMILRDKNQGVFQNSNGVPNVSESSHCIATIGAFAKQTFMSIREAFYKANLYFHLLEVKLRMQNYFSEVTDGLSIQATTICMGPQPTFVFLIVV